MIASICELATHIQPVRKFRVSSLRLNIFFCHQSTYSAMRCILKREHASFLFFAVEAEITIVKQLEKQII